MERKERLEQLKELKKAYGSGVLRARFGETDITYKSELQMRRTIQRIEAELGLKGRVSFVRPRVTKGMD